MKTVLKSAAVILPLFLLVLCSCKRTEEMSVGELREFVIKPENELVKELETANVNIEVVYWPRKLVIDDDDSLAMIQADSIDYFLLRYKPKNKSGHKEVFYQGNSAYLVIDHDTIRAIDEILVPEQNNVEQKYTVLYAFKSFIERRIATSDIQLIFNNDRSNQNHVLFDRTDIDDVNTIELNK
jgi:hypothetical protein